MPRILNVLLSTFLMATFSIPIAVFTPSFAADADVIDSNQSQNQALQSPAGKFVQGLGDHAIKIMANKQMSADQHSAEFKNILNDSFDLKIIDRFVSGRTWDIATPAQQAEYMELFKTLLIQNYGSYMTLASGDGFQVIGIRPEANLDTIVLSQFTHLDGSRPTSIDWRVRQKDGKTSVIDVVVEGISLCITQRDEYAAVVKNSGGQFDGLLVAMRNQQKTQSETASAN